MQNNLRRFTILTLVLAAGSSLGTRLNAQPPGAAPASQTGSPAPKTAVSPAPRTPVPTASRPAPTPTTPLTVVSEPGVDIVAPGSAHWNAGEVDPATTPHLERVFTLQNTTAHPIVIGQLRGSCGCETLLLTKDNTPLRQTSLLPGEKVQVRVSIRMAGQHGGEMHKMAWVYAPGNTTPLATLDIALSVRTSIIAAPSVLNFGALNGAVNASLPLTVSMDASLTTGGSLPPLVSSNPRISVLPEGKPQLLDRNGKPWIEQKYRIAMRGQAQSGPLSGALHFATAASAGMGVKPASAPGTALVSANTTPKPAPALTFSIPLVGEVSGGMAFAPKTVYFGSLTGGQGAKRQVLLSGSAADKLQNVTLSTSSPWVTAALISSGEAQPGIKPVVRMVEVTLKPNTPVGALQAQVIVTTPTGDKLLLPVVAEVTAKH